MSTDGALALIASLPPAGPKRSCWESWSAYAKSAWAILGKRPGAARTAVYLGFRTLVKRIDGRV